MHRTTLFHRDFVRLTAAHAIAALGWASMLLLPLYLDAIGASRAEIGTVMGSAALAGLAVRPLVGWALDRVGRRVVIALGSTLQAAGMASLWFIDAIDWRAYGVRALFGLGSAAVFTGYFAFVTDLVPSARRTEGIALFGISGLAPLLVNPLAGRLGVDAMAVRWFLPATSALLLLSLWPLLTIVEPARATAAPPRAAAILRTLAARPLWPAWMATLALAALIVCFQSFATVVAHARGLERPADFWLTYAIGAIGIRVVGARTPDRLGPHNLVAPSLAALVVGAVLLAGAADTTMYLAVGLLAGVGHGMGFPVLTSQVASRTPAAVRGSALAAFTGLWDCAFLLTPGILGAIADARGDGAMLVTVALAATVAIATWALLERGVRDKHLA